MIVPGCVSPLVPDYRTRLAIQNVGKGLGAWAERRVNSLGRSRGDGGR